tara:strand:- start:1164 stop:2357 length:1194 start_codon:yes stop_codon:yes gene_type:complete
MLTEIQYRTFDELLDSIKIDLPTIDLESIIEPQQLIKVAARVSYDLGLKVNPLKSKTIEVIKGIAKLPSDFSVLNFALLCDNKQTFYNPFPPKYSYKTYCQGVQDGQELAKDLTNAAMNTLYTTVIDVAPGNNTITHNLGTTNFIVQAIDNATNQFVDFDIDVVGSNEITVISTATVTVSSVTFNFVTGNSSNHLQSLWLELNPCVEGVVVDSCKNTTTCTKVTTSNCGDTVVSCEKKDEDCTYQYNTLIPLKINKTKTLSADSFNLMTKCDYAVMLKNGFLQANFDEGTVYINYQSLMEDDEGNLLVMSHPFVDEYYEYALKQRIFENLIMSGDVKYQNQLGLVEQRYRSARNNALGYINTPDFSELKKVWEMNRKAQYGQYYDMFKSDPKVNCHF